jgi:hypothetical protein
MKHRIRVATERTKIIGARPAGLKFLRHPARHLEVVRRDKRLPAVPLQIGRKTVQPLENLSLYGCDVEKRVRSEQADQRCVMCRCAAAQRPKTPA